MVGKDVGKKAYLPNATTILGAQDPVFDLRGIEQLDNLRVLNLNCERFTDLSPLAVTQITSLSIGGAPVRSLEPLRHLNLTELTVSGTLVSDLSPLADMQSLKYLDIADTKVSDVKVLHGLKNLETLQARNLDLRDIEGLPTGLKTLVLSRRPAPESEDLYRKRNPKIRIIIRPERDPDCRNKEGMQAKP
jgi:Leucine-rich repeat (LRR) protein